MKFLLSDAYFRNDRFCFFVLSFFASNYARVQTHSACMSFHSQGVCFHCTFFFFFVQSFCAPHSKYLWKMSGIGCPGRGLVNNSHWGIWCSIREECEGGEEIWKASSWLMSWAKGVGGVQIDPWLCQLSWYFSLSTTLITISVAVIKPSLSPYYALIHLDRITHIRVCFFFFYFRFFFFISC